MFIDWNCFLGEQCGPSASLLYPPRSSGGYIGITLSVRLSVQIRVRPITFLWFDIGLPYFAHGCITMRRCVTYIHDPDTTLNFDLKVKFIGFLTCFHVPPITFFWIDNVLPYFAHGCITIRQCVAYIDDLDLRPQYQNYIFTMNLSLAKCLCSLT